MCRGSVFVGAAARTYEVCREGEHKLSSVGIETLSGLDPSGTSDGGVHRRTRQPAEAEVEALANSVNTVGVMGKGIALQFKNAFPANFKAYEAACNKQAVRLGEVFVFDNGRLTTPHWIINFPTKGHWRAKSRIRDVADGLDDLRHVIEELEISSVALPPLGCGHGGLDWSEVRSVAHEPVGLST